MKRRILKQKSGMTMANVLVSFVILILTVLMFLQVYVLVERLIAKSDEVCSGNTELIRKYYLDELNADTTENGNCRWKDQNGNTFDFPLSVYRYSDGEQNVYSFGQHKTVTEPEVASQ